GKKFVEKRSALSFLAAVARRRASESFGLPRRLPRALAALRTADVLALMISRSCWATTRRGLPVAGHHLSEPLRHRPRNHRHRLERPPLLRARPTHGRTAAQQS